MNGPQILISCKTFGAVTVLPQRTLNQTGRQELLSAADEGRRSDGKPRSRSRRFKVDDIF